MIPEIQIAGMGRRELIDLVRQLERDCAHTKAIVQKVLERATWDAEERGYDEPDEDDMSRALTEIHLLARNALKGSQP